MWINGQRWITSRRDALRTLGFLSCILGAILPISGQGWDVTRHGNRYKWELEEKGYSYRGEADLDKMLAAEDSFVRMLAVGFIAIELGEKGLDRIHLMLADEAFYVRLIAARSLFRLGDKRGKEALKVEFLKTIAKDPETLDSGQIKYALAAGKSLAETGSDLPFDLAMTVLGRPNRFGRHQQALTIIVDIVRHLPAEDLQNENRAVEALMQIASLEQDPKMHSTMLNLLSQKEMARWVRDNVLSEMLKADRLSEASSERANWILEQPPVKN